MWHFHDPIKLLDLIKGVDRWRETSMEAEDVALDHGGQWQVVKQASERLPNVGVSVLAKAFIVESIDLCDLLAFMVSSQDCDPVWMPDLV